MSKLLSALASLTLGGSAAVLLLALLGRSSYRARWRCWAWAVLCLRLLLPLPAPDRTDSAVRPPIQLPALTDRVLYQSAPEEEGDPSAPQTPAVSPPMLQTPPNAGKTGNQPSPTAPTEGCFSLSPSQVLTWVWLAGAAAVLGRAGIAHLRFLRYLRRWAKPLHDPETVQLFQWTGTWSWPAMRTF